MGQLLIVLLFIAANFILSSSALAISDNLLDRPSHDYACEFILNREALIRFQSQIAERSELLYKNRPLSPMAFSFSQSVVRGRAVAAFGSSAHDIVDLIASMPTASEYHLFDIMDYSYGGYHQVVYDLQKVLRSISLGQMWVLSDGVSSLVPDQISENWFSQNLPHRPELQKPSIFLFEMIDHQGVAHFKKVYLHALDYNDTNQLGRALASIEDVGLAAAIWNSGTMVTSNRQSLWMIGNKLKLINGILVFHLERGEKIVPITDWYTSAKTKNPFSILVSQEVTDESVANFKRRRFSLGLSTFIRDSGLSSAKVTIGQPYARTKTRGADKNLIPVILQFLN